MDVILLRNIQAVIPNILYIKETDKNNVMKLLMCQDFIIFFYMIFQLFYLNKSRTGLGEIGATPDFDFNGQVTKIALIIRFCFLSSFLYTNVIFF